VAEAFCASRLAGRRGLAFGTLPVGFHFTDIVERARPAV
jgi:putative acyl-CoA dehydrogenase